MVTGALYLFGAWSFACGIAGYYRVSAHPRLGLGIGAAVLLALYYYSQKDSSLWMRSYLLNAGLGLMQLLPAPHIFSRRPANDWLERTMYGSSVLFAINTSIRPLLSPMMMLATTLLFVLLFALLLANTVRSALASCAPNTKWTL